MENTTVSPHLFTALLWLCGMVAAVLIGVFIAYLRSQTRVKRAEQAISQAGQRCFAVLNALAPAVIVLDEQGVIEDFNRGAERMFGCAAKDMVGREINSLRLFTLEGGAKPFGQGRTTGRGGPRVGIQAQGRRLDGSTFPAELVVGEALIGSGRLIVGQVQDLTQRRQAEEVLQRASALPWSLLDAAGALVLVLDHEGRIERLNQACRQATGYRQEEVAGSYFWEVLLTPESAASVKESFGKQRLGDLLRMAEGEWLGKDGRRRKIAFRITWLAEAGGAPEHFMLVGFDITDRVERGERRLEEARLEALARLAGEIASRFTDWLTVVNGYSDLVLAGLADGDPLRSDVQEMSKAAERAVSLARQLQAFGRKQVLRPRLVDINALVQELTQENQRWELKLAPSLGFVNVDPEELRQVILMLARQARQLSPEGAGLAFVTTEVSADGGEACVMLAIGAEEAELPAQAREHLFEPFRLADLSLSAAHGFLKQSGGDIHVTTQPGRGLRFEIYLPRAADAAASAGVPGP